MGIPLAMSKPDLMVVEFITPVTVVTESLTARVSGGDFQVEGFAEALETGEPRRDLGIEVDQYLVMIG